MKKYILIIVILAVLGFLAFKYSLRNTSLEIEDSPATSTALIASSTDTNLNPSVGTTSLKEEAWAVLLKYLEASKKHDLESLRKVSYQISDVCEDKSQEKECFNRMDNVYYFGTNLNKAEFKNIWSDKKQIILTTDLIRQEDEKMISYSRAIIYFVYDKGAIKLLKFNDSKGVSMPKKDKTVPEINAYLKKRMEDLDQDGREDELESCVDQADSCIKTDPKLRDTDKDGYWDGIDVLFYK